MLLRRGILVCISIVTMQLLGTSLGFQSDPEYRAKMEKKVMSELSLKDLEAMVENDDRVLNAPQGRIIIIPNPKEGQADDDREAIVIDRKPKKQTKKEAAPKVESKAEFRRVEEEGPEYKFSKVEFDEDIRRFDPGYERQEEDLRSLFGVPDLESAASFPVHQFYESMVESVLRREDFRLGEDPLDILRAAASEGVPQYKPRFDYDAYSKDSTETKLQGKPYWNENPEGRVENPEGREELVDENGCRTVIKKVVDPEDGKKSSSGKAKSMVITKECESPLLDGPDAKIVEARPFRLESSRFRSPLFENQPSTYDSTRPDELNLKKADQRDPLAHDYIDRMLEQHFKGFPGFNNPLSSFSGYQERFKQQAPEQFKDTKPTVNVQSYEYSHPKSGFEDSRRDSEEATRNEAPPREYQHHYHYDYPEKVPRKTDDSEYQDESKEDGKPEEPEKPKTMKKSFAYYRKDNPKTDPDDHQYAEEYGTGNYRSFSSSYDSEKDGPKKKQQRVSN